MRCWRCLAAAQVKVESVGFRPGPFRKRIPLKRRLEENVG
jgi:hypothetical protein